MPSKARKAAARKAVKTPAGRATLKALAADHPNMVKRAAKKYPNVAKRVRRAS